VGRAGTVRHLTRLGLAELITCGGHITELVTRLHVLWQRGSVQNWLIAKTWFISCQDDGSFVEFRPIPAAGPGQEKR
jgi:hypothetical protein